MKINRHNLTIVTHCAPKDLQGYITKGLQFTDKGTIAINGAYSVAVSALQLIDKEAVPAVISPEHTAELLKNIPPEGEDISVAHLPRLAGVPAEIKWKNNHPIFELYINADYLLKLAQSARDFCESSGDEDPVVRFQFVSKTEPVRLAARNTTTGQKWEALLMPRKPATDESRFSAAAPVPPPPPPVGYTPAGPEAAHCVPAPPVEEDEFEKAVRLAASL